MHRHGLFCLLSTPHRLCIVLTALLAALLQTALGRAATAMTTLAAQNKQLAAPPKLRLSTPRARITSTASTRQPGPQRAHATAAEINAHVDAQYAFFSPCKPAASPVIA